jgi:hypothetical protein
MWCTRYVCRPGYLMFHWILNWKQWSSESVGSLTSFFLLYLYWNTSKYHVGLSESSVELCNWHDGMILNINILRFKIYYIHDFKIMNYFSINVTCKYDVCKSVCRTSYVNSFWRDISNPRGWRKQTTRSRIGQRSARHVDIYLPCLSFCLQLYPTPPINIT